MYKRIEELTSDSNYVSLELSYEHSHVVSVEDVYETPNEPFETLVKQSLQTRQVGEKLHNQLGSTWIKIRKYASR